MIDKRTFIRVLVFIAFLLFVIALPISARWDSRDADVIIQLDPKTGPQ